MKLIIHGQKKKNRIFQADSSDLDGPVRVSEDSWLVFWKFSLSWSYECSRKKRKKNPAFWEKGGWFDEEGIWWEKFVLAREELSAPQRTQRSRRRNFLQHRSDAKLVLITTC